MGGSGDAPSRMELDLNKLPDEHVEEAWKDDGSAAATTSQQPCPLSSTNDEQEQQVAQACQQWEQTVKGGKATFTDLRDACDWAIDTLQRVGGEALPTSAELCSDNLAAYVTASAVAIQHLACRKLLIRSVRMTLDLIVFCIDSQAHATNNNSHEGEPHALHAFRVRYVQMVKLLFAEKSESPTHSKKQRLEVGPIKAADQEPSHPLVEHVLAKLLHADNAQLDWVLGHLSVFHPMLFVPYFIYASSTTLTRELLLRTASSLEYTARSCPQETGLAMLEFAARCAAIACLPAGNVEDTATANQLPSAADIMARRVEEEGCVKLFERLVDSCLQQLGAYELEASTVSVLQTGSASLLQKLLCATDACLSEHLSGAETCNHPAHGFLAGIGASVKLLWAKLVSLRTAGQILLQFMERAILCGNPQPAIDLLEVVTWEQSANSTSDVLDFRLAVVNHVSSIISNAIPEARIVVIDAWLTQVVGGLSIEPDDRALQALNFIKQLAAQTFSSPKKAAFDESMPFTDFAELIKQRLTAILWLPLLQLLRRNSWQLRIATLQLLCTLPVPSSNGLVQLGNAVQAVLAWFLTLLEPASTYSEDDAVFVHACARTTKRLLATLCHQQIDMVAIVVDLLLDYSFICQWSGALSKDASANRKPSTRYSLAAFALDCYGRLVAPEELHAASLANPAVSLLQQNRRRFAGSIQQDAVVGEHKQSANLTHSSMLPCLCSGMTQEPKPNSTLATVVTLITTRLSTPHEVSPTVEQYDEILPRRPTFPRHMFIVDCFSRNPLLFQLLQLIAQQSPVDLRRCTELPLTLLADTIGIWHDLARTYAHKSSQAPTDAGLVQQTVRVLNLLTAVDWLPHPILHASEIVDKLPAADVCALLQAVWHCLRDTASMRRTITTTASYSATTTSSMAALFTQSPASLTLTAGATTSAPSSLPANAPAQAPSFETLSMQAAIPHWELQLQSILHRNIASIGPQFAAFYRADD
eukprot:jgi/Chlat1/5137/Chrsp33S05130